MPFGHELMLDRERMFWDNHVPTLERCVREFQEGPDLNTNLMLDAAGPLAGMSVLDFGCGAGITSAWAAQRGANVTAIDVSSASIARARELADRVGLSIEFVAGEMARETFSSEAFEAVIGRYVLHHVDLGLVAPMLRDVLVPNGKAAFVETMGLNPVLRLARRWLPGRAGIARFGSDDERPLTHNDLDVLRMVMGPVDLRVAEMTFLRIFDRNVLRFRLPWASAAFRAADDVAGRCGLARWSYHQVVCIEPTESSAC